MKRHLLVPLILAFASPALAAPLYPIAFACEVQRVVSVSKGQGGSMEVDERKLPISFFFPAASGSEGFRILDPNKLVTPVVSFNVEPTVHGYGFRFGVPDGKQILMLYFKESENSPTGLLMISDRVVSTVGADPDDHIAYYGQCQPFEGKAANTAFKAAPTGSGTHK